MDAAVTKHYTTFGLLAAGAATAKGKRTAKLNRIGIFNSNFSSCLRFLGPPHNMKLRFSSAGCYTTTATATNLFLDKSASSSAPLPLLRSLQLFSSSLSTEAPLEVHEETVISEIQTGSQSNMVHVKFMLQKSCLFGEEFLLVGDDPMFGLWDPLNAIPMHWSDDHMWKAEMDIPVGKSIQFKFILRGLSGEVYWQPGPDRIMQTWETTNTIIVSEDWDNAESQKIIEEPLAEVVLSPENEVTNNCSPTSSEKLLVRSFEGYQGTQQGTVDEKLLQSLESMVQPDDTQQGTVDEKLLQILEYKVQLSSNDGLRQLASGLDSVSKSDSVFPEVVNGKAVDDLLASDVGKDCNSSQLSRGQVETVASNKNLLAEETITLSDEPISSEADATVSSYGMLTEDKAHQEESNFQSTAGVPINDIWWGVKVLNQLLLNLGFSMNPSAD